LQKKTINLSGLKRKGFRWGKFAEEESTPEINPWTPPLQKRSKLSRDKGGKREVDKKSSHPRQKLCPGNGQPTGVKLKITGCGGKGMVFREFPLVHNDPFKEKKKKVVGPLKKSLWGYMREKGECLIY